MISKIKHNDLLPFSAKDRLKLFFKIKRGNQLDYPRQYWIESTNECNLRCIMCPQSIGPERKKKNMDMDVFTRIIDQIYIVKPKIMLHMGGEPLLNKDLFAMIEYAKKRGCCIGFNTNATLLTEEMSRRILESSLDSISFSFDGFTPEIYEKVRVGARFDRVKSQIEYFLKLRQEMKTKRVFVKIEILEMEETRRQIRDFYGYWKAKKADIVTAKLAGSWLGLVRPLCQVNVRKYGDRLCRDIFQKCAILADGTVVPCCNDIKGRLPLGNIMEQSFDEIWNGESYNCLRKRHLENNIPHNIICYGCDFRYSRSKSEQITEWFIGNLFWRSHLSKPKRHDVYE